MKYEIVQLGKKTIDDFWQLGKELFLEEEKIYENIRN